MAARSGSGDYLDRLWPPGEANVGDAYARDYWLASEIDRHAAQIAHNEKQRLRDAEVRRDFRRALYVKVVVPVIIACAGSGVVLFVNIHK